MPKRVLEVEGFRFRCLLHGFSVSLENAKLYIVALAILHNIAIDIKEDLDVTFDDTENAPEEPRPT